MQKARSARPARGSRRPSRRRNRRAQELLMQRLEDCHTVTGIRRDSGKVDDAATVQTYRHYLLDARFGVLLEGPSLLLEKVAAALRNPKWGVWLGRKCCLPASPLLVAPPGSRAVVWVALLQRAGYTGTEIEDQFDRVREPRGEIIRHRHDAAGGGLGALRGDFNEPLGGVHLRPVEPHDFRRAQAGKRADGKEGDNLRLCHG